MATFNELSTRLISLRNRFWGSNQLTSSASFAGLIDKPIDNWSEYDEKIAEGSSCCDHPIFFYNMESTSWYLARIETYQKLLQQSNCLPTRAIAYLLVMGEVLCQTLHRFCHQMVELCATLLQFADPIMWCTGNFPGTMGTFLSQLALTLEFIVNLVIIAPIAGLATVLITQGTMLGELAHCVSPTHAYEEL